MNILTKLIIFIYSIIIAITLVLGTSFTKTSFNYIKQSTIKKNSSYIQQISSAISAMQKSVEEIANQMILNTHINGLLKSSVSITDDNSLSFNKDRSLINSFLVSHSAVNGIIMYDLNREAPLFSAVSNINYPLFAQLKDIQNSPYITSTIHNKGAPYWFTVTQDDTSIITNNKTTRLFLSRLMIDYHTYEPIGILLISLDVNAIQETFFNYTVHEDSIYLFSKDYKMITSNTSNVLNESIVDHIPNKGSGYFEENDTLVFYHYFDDLLMIYTSANGKNQMEAYGIIISVCIVILLCLLISLPTIYFVSKYYVSPIKQLVKSMQKFERGDFDQSVEIHTKDELFTLAEGYNHMVINIKKLIEDNYILELQKKEAEWNALQANINPHFLYNTLDTLFWMSLKQNQNQIADTIYALSKLFRLSLNQGKNFTKVVHEKEFLSHYLTLHKMRLKDSLHYTLNFAEATLNHSIPKLLLQPFVENALVHGFKDVKEGCLTVTGDIDDNGYLVFVIEDNGIGMEDNQLGYGTMNVKDRLSILYKDDYSINIKSGVGEGTTITLVIPIIPHDNERRNHDKLINY